MKAKNVTQARSKMATVTVRIGSKLVRAIRRLAATEKTTVSALVSPELEKMVKLWKESKEANYRSA
jgi:hypothetical protein